MVGIRSFPIGFRPIFRFHVSFRGCIFIIYTKNKPYFVGSPGGFNPSRRTASKGWASIPTGGLERCGFGCCALPGTHISHRNPGKKTENIIFKSGDMVVFLESNIILLDFFTLCCFEHNFNNFWEAFHHVVHQGEWFTKGNV